MSTKLVFSLSIIALLFTVPWWTNSPTLIYGFPAWAFYSLLATIAYSFIIAILLHVHWSNGTNKDN